MRCDVCGKCLRLDFKEIRVDTLYKEYFCRNWHKTIYRRYGRTIEINGRKMITNESFDFTEAARLQERKKNINAKRTAKNRL